jgi:hypothetical protein
LDREAESVAIADPIAIFTQSIDKDSQLMYINYQHSNSPIAIGKSSHGYRGWLASTKLGLFAAAIQ